MSVFFFFFSFFFFWYPFLSVCFPSYPKDELVESRFRILLRVLVGGRETGESCVAHPVVRTFPSESSARTRACTGGDADIRTKKHVRSREVFLFFCFLVFYFLFFACRQCAGRKSLVCFLFSFFFFGTCSSPLALPLSFSLSPSLSVLFFFFPFPRFSKIVCAFCRSISVLCSFCIFLQDENFNHAFPPSPHLNNARAGRISTDEPDSPPGGECLRTEGRILYKKVPSLHRRYTVVTTCFKSVSDFPSIDHFRYTVRLIEQIETN